MFHFIKTKQTGFTLIEIIVSLALFSVVITIAVGALLILIASNRQLQNEQSVLSNLSFALDSMTREIRTGSNYYCAANDSASFGTPGNRIFASTGSLNLTDGIDASTGDCLGGNIANRNFHGIAFNEGGTSVTAGATSGRIAYFFDRSNGTLSRRLSGQPPESIVSDGIFIREADFYVTGSYRPDGPPPNDNIQPRITIVIQAYNSRADAEADTAGNRAYVIQTTVTQRSLDI
jgi:prepilin-type N-terminal cleavage/methylation domain-containing protein